MRSVVSQLASPYADTASDVYAALCNQGASIRSLRNLFCLIKFHFSCRPVAIDRYQFSSSQSSAWCSRRMLRTGSTVGGCSQYMVQYSVAHCMSSYRSGWSESASFSRPTSVSSALHGFPRRIESCAEPTLFSGNSNQERVREDRSFNRRYVLDTWKECTSLLLRILVREDPASLYMLAQMLVATIRSGGNAVYVTLFGEILVSGGIVGAYVCISRAM